MSQTFLEDIPEFLEIQRNSFLRVLDTGLIQALEKINPIVSPSQPECGLLFYPKEYVLVLPENTITEAFLQGKTYGCKIYVPAIIYKKEKKNVIYALEKEILQQDSVYNKLSPNLLSTLKKDKIKLDVEKMQSLNFEFNASVKTLSSTLWPIFSANAWPRTAPLLYKGKRTKEIKQNLFQDSRNVVFFSTKGTTSKNYFSSLFISTTQRPFEKNNLWAKNSSLWSLESGSSKPFMSWKLPQGIKNTESLNNKIKDQNHKTKIRGNFAFRLSFLSFGLFLKNLMLCSPLVFSYKSNTLSTKKRMVLEDDIKKQHQMRKNNKKNYEIPFGLSCSSAYLNKNIKSGPFFLNTLERSFRTKNNGSYAAMRSVGCRSEILESRNKVPLFWSNRDKAYQKVIESLVPCAPSVQVQFIPLRPNYGKKSIFLQLKDFLKRTNKQFIDSSKKVKKFTNNIHKFALPQKNNKSGINYNFDTGPEQFLNNCKEIPNAKKINNLSRKEWVCIGVLPLMTPRGHFIINGSHRIVVSQMGRAPGLYYQTGEKLQATIVPAKGAWLRISVKENDNGEIKIWVRITPQRKIPYKIFIETYKYLENFKSSEKPQFKFLNLTYKAINSKIKHIDKHYAIGVISGQIQRTLLNYTSYNLGAEGRKRINERLGIKENAGYLTSKDISLIKRNLLKYLGQNSPTSFDDDIDHLQNRRVRTCGELLQSEIEVGMARLKKTAGKQLEEFANSNLPVVEKASFRLKSKPLDSSDKKLSTTGTVNSKIQNEKTREFFNSGETPTISFNKPINSVGFSGIAKENVNFSRKSNAESNKSPLVLSQGMRRQVFAQKSLSVLVSAKSLGQMRTSGAFKRSSLLGPSATLIAEQSRNVSGNWPQPLVLPYLVLQSKNSSYTVARNGFSLRAIKGQECYDGLGGKSLSFLRAHYQENRSVPLSLWLWSFGQQNGPLKQPCLPPSGHFFSSSRLRRETTINLFDVTSVYQDPKTKLLKGLVSVPLSQSLNLPFRVGPSLISNHGGDTITLVANSNQQQINDNRVSKNILKPKSGFSEKSQQKKWSPYKVISTKAFAGALREFFGSNPLSQYMDQTNPLAEITHKRRLSSLGPGGVDRASAGIAIRGIHPSHYGRICPIETPEGKNAGLVNSMTMWARVNEDGFLETPYLKVKGGSIMSHTNTLSPNWYFVPTKKETRAFSTLQSSSAFSSYSKAHPLGISSLENTAEGAEIYKHQKLEPLQQECTTSKTVKIVTSDLNIPASLFLPNISLPTRDGTTRSFERAKRGVIDFCGVSPIQNISVATSLIPFLEHDDATRALMGSNMQRQAVPLLKPQGPLVRTGLEGKVVGESGHALQAACSGVISIATRTLICIETFSTNIWDDQSSNFQEFNSYLPQTVIDGNKNLLFLRNGIRGNRLIFLGCALQDTGALIHKLSLSKYYETLRWIELRNYTLKIKKNKKEKSVQHKTAFYNYTLSSKKYSTDTASSFWRNNQMPLICCAVLAVRSKHTKQKNGLYNCFPAALNSKRYLGGAPTNLVEKKNLAHHQSGSLSKNISALQITELINTYNFITVQKNSKVYSSNSSGEINITKTFVENTVYPFHTKKLVFCSTFDKSSPEELLSPQSQKDFKALSCYAGHSSLWPQTRAPVCFSKELLCNNMSKTFFRKSRLIKRKTSIQKLQEYTRSNQATICVQRPAVKVGDWVQKGDLIGDCSASVNGVLSLGQNIVVAYLPMEGFNFEDAIVVSDRLVHEELYTSIHVQRVEFDMDAVVKKNIPKKIKIKKQKNYKTSGPDWITKQNPHLLQTEKELLNPLGIIKVGSWVGPGDVLISKVVPVDRKIAPSRHLLLAVFQEKRTKTLDTDDTSLRVPKGIHGRVINVKVVGNGTVRPLDRNKLHLKKNIHAKKEKSLPFFSVVTKSKTNLTLVQQSLNPVLWSCNCTCAPQGARSEELRREKVEAKAFLSTRLEMPSKRVSRPLSPKTSVTGICNIPIGEDFITRYPSITQNLKKNSVAGVINVALHQLKKHTNKISILPNKQARAFAIAKKVAFFPSFGEPKKHSPYYAEDLITLAPQDITESILKGSSGYDVMHEIHQKQSRNFDNITRSKLQLKSSPQSTLSGDSVLATTTNFVEVETLPGNSFINAGVNGTRKGYIQHAAALNKPQTLEKKHIDGDYKIIQVRVYIAERKRLQVGDKMSGRHGNKGIVSTILPREDMPFLPDGTSVDMVLNPLGIPSRMNVGQVFECLLGLASSICGEIIGHTPFDEMYGPEASRSLVYLFLYLARLRSRTDWLFQPNFPGKTIVFDGRTGLPFEQWVTVGRAYMLKLIHMVDEKIHARSIGPRSLVTQQPVKGRARGGGQRLGEMELWALEGFGAAYTLQEILTLKSDDIKGRENVENSIIFSTTAKAHIPETFRMMLFELRCLCLNVELN